MSDREKAQEICQITHHVWKDVYYGVECINCGLFYPDGCEPWMPLDDEELDCCPHCGKEYQDFSDMGCGHCDQRSPDWGVL